MITVRFPTGVAVQYNDAHYCERAANGYTDLYSSKGGSWIAQVPTGAAIVEVKRPCRVYNSNHEPGSIVDALNKMLGDPAQRTTLPMYELAELKSRLKAFNALRRRWK